MPGELPLIVLTDRTGPEGSWTDYDFFADGLENGLITLIFDELDDEALAPFREVGVEEVVTPEFVSQREMLAAAGEEAISRMVPEIAQAVLEDMPGEFKLFGPLEEGETREERRESFYWLGYVSSLEIVSMLAEAIAQHAAEDGE